VLPAHGTDRPDGGRYDAHVPSTLIRNATILTMNDTWDVMNGAVSVRDGRIAAIGREPSEAHDRTIDAAGGLVLPGFIQTHLHLCQTLFRGYADDLKLMDWLQRRIWPMEAAHTPDSLRAATRLACLELLRGGTTAVLTMETVHDTDAVFEAATEVGIRATIGKCMMDMPAADTPARLREETGRSLDESLALHRRWDNSSNGRIRAAFAPRFAVSCSRALLEAVASLSGRELALVHTHASEQREEIEIVRKLSGRSNIEYLADVGLATARLCAAHCVYVEESEIDVLATTGVKVMHCPGSNLKLGSGVAPVREMIAKGVCVSLGADGAACNNHLDMFGEMRLAATLQATRHAPGALTAKQVVWMATRNGARTLGLEHEIGSIEIGRRADLILVDITGPHLQPGPDPYSTVAYAARPHDVRLTMVDGEVLVDEFAPTRMDAREVVSAARREARALAQRAGL
jgi:5-methylthioadenosine/S-adenosylhomocysteine deaminase